MLHSQHHPCQEGAPGGNSREGRDAPRVSGAALPGLRLRGGAGDSLSCPPYPCPGSCPKAEMQGPSERSRSPPVTPLLPPGKPGLLTMDGLQELAGPHFS
ncbi:hypothetical protein CapIbe_015484 [Capra ibex]